MRESGALGGLETCQKVIPDPSYVIHHGLEAVRDLIACVQQRLAALGFTATPVPLAELHRHLSEEAMALDAHYTNAVGRAFYVPNETIQQAYEGLIGFLARHLFPWDFLYQAQPIVRFHFPVAFPEAMRTRDGQPRQIHSDLLGGHPAAMVQGWVALTDCEGSAALQCSGRDDGMALLARYRARLGPNDPPLADSLRHYYAQWDTVPGFANAIRAACRTLPMSAGDVLFFDSHCLHGATENDTEATRVSLDFRILPVDHEQATLDTAGTPTARRFCRGELFAARSAREL